MLKLLHMAQTSVVHLCCVLNIRLTDMHTRSRLNAYYGIYHTSPLFCVVLNETGAINGQRL